ncbi:hypothetical protein NPA31_002605 [Aurantimonas sp. MSK8Z-1]|uniref:hypothetical protein n=1 Tax=Mangrovibrevibacter kandeliae TaxID=2968473 RepID=UPI00211783DE|nr:hypothetical protein [Aurantimonas sp. MSK8Z-1]MCW4113854.1 hypothetical protein [Aurantimonas sp. MSK8Z-1]
MTGEPESVPAAKPKRKGKATSRTYAARLIAILERELRVLEAALAADEPKRGSRIRQPAGEPAAPNDAAGETSGVEKTGATGAQKPTRGAAKGAAVGGEARLKTAAQLTKLLEDLIELKQTEALLVARAVEDEAETQALRDELLLRLHAVALRNGATPGVRRAAAEGPSDGSTASGAMDGDCSESDGPGLARL